MFLCDRDGVVLCVNKGDGVRLCNIIWRDGVLLLDTIDGVDVMLCDILGDDVVVYYIIGGDGVVSCSISFFPSTAILWNNLQPETVEASSITVFNNLLINEL